MILENDNNMVGPARLERKTLSVKLEETHNCIADELSAVDCKIRDQLRQVCADDALLNAVFRDLLDRQGKKLRPRLALLSAFALRDGKLTEPPFESTREAVISLAAIVELVHNASLMHDDVLDRAATRRGVESLNARFGDKIAILAGDILYSQAFEMLIDTASPETTRELISCVRHMCRGEVINLCGAGPDVYESILEDKTASLMQFCCKAGVDTVRMPGDDDAILEAFASFGLNFGMVYQLADDFADGDVDIATVTRETILSRLRHYAALASEALAAIPDSIYTRGLEALLSFVIQGVESASGELVLNTAPPDLIAGAA